MQTDAVDHDRTNADAKGLRAERSGGDFNSLLAGMASARMVAMATLMTDATGLSPRTESQRGSARRSRIAAETQSARQAERNASDTRRADPSSIQRGVVSTRHERIVTEHRQAAAEAARGSQTVERETKVMSGRGTESQVSDDRGSGRPEPSVVQRAHRADQPTTKTTAGAQDQWGRQSAARSSVFQSAPSGARQASGAATLTARTGAGVTKLAGVSGGVRTSAGTPSPAQAVARMLAGRGGTDTARAPAGGPQMTDARTGQNAGSKTQTTSTTAGRDAPANQAKAAESPESLRRTAFEQLVKSIRLNRGARSSSATIRLNPPELGRMRIDVRMVDDTLRIKVEVSTVRARGLMEARADELVGALREHGIKVERFDVSGASLLDYAGTNEADGRDAQAPGRELRHSVPRERQQRHHGGETEHADTTPSEAVLAAETYAGSETRLDIRI